MRVSWFFATTPIPRRPYAAFPPKRKHESASSWWSRAADRYLAWSERTLERSNRTWMHV